MLGNVVRNIGDRAASALISRLARVGMRPGTCNVCEVIAAVCSGAALACKYPGPALILFVLHGFFDYLDGALRRSGVPAVSNDVLRAERDHALADKAAELALLLGIAIGEWAPWGLVMAAMVSSLVATLTGFWACRARGIPRDRSVFDRTDRMLVLFGCLLLRQIMFGLYAIVIMNCIIIVQRLLEGVRKSMPASYNVDKKTN
jgi:phosphatidylglycerophosphate synthase